MKKNLILLLIIAFIFGCKDDEDNITIRDIIGFNGYAWGTKITDFPNDYFKDYKLEGDINAKNFRYSFRDVKNPDIKEGDTESRYNYNQEIIFTFKDNKLIWGGIKYPKYYPTNFNTKSRELESLFGKPTYMDKRFFEKNWREYRFETKTSYILISQLEKSNYEDSYSDCLVLYISKINYA